MKENSLKAIFAAAFGVLAAYFGKVAIPLCVLLAVMLLDYATGMTKAWVTATLSSRAGVIGIIKKVCYFIIVCVAGAVDYLVRAGLTDFGVEINTKFLFCGIVIVWLIINECISILENLDAIGVPVPKWLLTIIHKLKGSVDKATYIKDEPEEGERE